MKLEIGMYVRFKYGIVKYFNNPQMAFAIRNLVARYEEVGDTLIVEDYIVKASHNIIDLIEVGDYVNGCYVREITKFPRDNLKTIITETSNGFEDETEWFRSEEIKSIVTKEQFESMSYKVGE